MDTPTQPAPGPTRVGLLICDACPHLRGTGSQVYYCGHAEALRLPSNRLRLIRLSLPLAPQRVAHVITPFFCPLSSAYPEAPP